MSPSCWSTSLVKLVILSTNLPNSRPAASLLYPCSFVHRSQLHRAFTRPFTGDLVVLPHRRILFTTRPPDLRPQSAESETMTRRPDPSSWHPESPGALKTDASTQAKRSEPPNQREAQANYIYIYICFSFFFFKMVFQGFPVAFHLALLGVVFLFFQTRSTPSFIAQFQPFHSRQEALRCFPRLDVLNIRRSDDNMTTRSPLPQRSTMLDYDIANYDTLLLPWFSKLEGS